jgi:NhaP-type Na+/H+ or K+/H+ antiporter
LPGRSRQRRDRPCHRVRGWSRHLVVDDHLIRTTISVVLAYGSYIVADQIHLSGVMRR